MVTHCGLTVLTHGWGRVLDLKSSPSSSGQSWWPNPKYKAFGDIWNWDHSPDSILFWGELDPYNTLFFQRTLSFFFLSNLWACLHTDALWLWDTLLTHAVHCWCWSHCGMAPLFLRCPIHRKERISFPHQERFPFLHSVSFTLGNTPISPRPFPGTDTTSDFLIYSLPLSPKGLRWRSSVRLRGKWHGPP